MAASRFGIAVMIGAASFLGFLFIYSLVKDVPVEYTIISRVLLGSLLALSLISLKLPPKNRAYLAVTVVSTGITLFAADTFLEGTTGSPIANAAQQAVARREEVPFDTRTALQVIDDLRGQGVNAYPLVARGTFGDRRIEVDGQVVFPLSGISNTPTVFCNELGEYPIYHSDEHGFNNPAGIWGRDNLAIASIGDSFGYGVCVGQDKNPTSLIRKAYPNTINLSISSTGPLGQLAIMKEYMGRLNPRAVLWFFYEGNDLPTLKIEYEFFQPLSKYLESDYRQDLMPKQAEIDQGLRAMVDDELSARREGRAGNRYILNRLTLRAIRDRIDLWVQGYDNCPPPEENLPLLDRVLRDGASYVDSWGGSIFLVYLPTWARYVEPSKAPHCSPEPVPFRDQVISIAEEAGLKVIDITKVFDSHPDPVSLYPFRSDGHYTEEGYRLVADTVLQSVTLKTLLRNDK